jgi:hypothetical protein
MGEIAERGQLVGLEGLQVEDSARYLLVEHMYVRSLAEADSEVAVGTGLAASPPHRPQRAALPHWVPASGTSVEAHVGIGMKRSCGREPPAGEAAHPFPVHAPALAAAA